MLKFAVDNPNARLPLFKFASFVEPDDRTW